MKKDYLKSKSRNYTKKIRITKKLMSIKKIIHRIKHYFHWNGGIAYNYWNHGKYLACFKCTCGELQDCEDITIFITNGYQYQS